MARKKQRYWVMVRMGKRTRAYDYHGEGTGYAEIKASSAAAAKRAMRKRLRISSGREK